MVLGLFRRIAALLAAGISPVFVFDGGTPALKRQVMAARRGRRAKGEAQLAKAREQLMRNKLRRYALGDADALKGPKQKRKRDMFEVGKPPSAAEAEAGVGAADEGSSAEDSDGALGGDSWAVSVDSVDVDSEQFTSLPPEIQCAPRPLLLRARFARDIDGAEQVRGAAGAAGAAEDKVSAEAGGGSPEQHRRVFCRSADGGAPAPLAGHHSAGDGPRGSPSAFRRRWNHCTQDCVRGNLPPRPPPSLEGVGL